LQSLLDQSYLETKKVRLQLDHLSNSNGDRVQFMKDKIEEVVNKEVKLKLNNLAQLSNNPMQLENELFQ